MAIVDIPNEELRVFAEKAQEYGWDVDWPGNGILYLYHDEHQSNISISPKVVGESWMMLNKVKGKSHIVSYGDLMFPISLPKSIL